jgi:hypothetical protein
VVVFTLKEAQDHGILLSNINSAWLTRKLPIGDYERGVKSKRRKTSTDVVKKPKKKRADA